MSGFSYFYKHQAEQFVFYRIPKVPFTEARFASLSTDAKLLYGLMLDRMALSRENGWHDGKSRVYIDKEKANKLMSELDERGIGLIEAKRQGLGRLNMIFVKDFSSDARADIGLSNTGEYSADGLMRTAK
jgi:hypothetical protein